VGGSADIVVDSVTGLMVPPKDPDALANAMRKIRQMSLGERRAMGARARRHVEQTFDLQRIVQSWERVYEELLVRASGRARDSSARTAP
jgi:glycosyltransferase involved in cell wall biosynthesis